MKKFAIAASLVAAVALGAFARDKFRAASATAYYIDATSTCVPLTAGLGVSL